MSLFLLIAVHIVGTITILLGYTDSLMHLTPYNLLFCSALLVYNAEKPDASYVLWFLICAVGGFLLEAIGTATGLIFGSYIYGNGMGIRVLSVPLMIGLSWSVLVFSTSAILLPYGLHWVLRSIIGALLMVGYDILLEPVAMRFDFWDWEGGVIPLQNYVAWFVIGLMMQLGVNWFVKPLKNRMALYIFIIQALFFALLIYTEKLKVF
ncbi:MAG TPA: carotenoid biosynthesis protein [Bacteroidales bacterium]|nr:carotenoid biosynthesis protein [Bacteroidales bacterium]